MPIYRIRTIYWKYRRPPSTLRSETATARFSRPLPSNWGGSMLEEKKKIMTTDAGRPVGDNQNSLTVGPHGPVVFEDFLLFEKMAHFNRERIPERVVHAKGSGAYGYFVCTNPLA